MDELELRVAWVRSVAPDSVPGARAAFDDMLSRHREPQRHYHTVTHVRWVVRHVCSIASTHPGVDLDIAVAAACYHDVVYTPSSSSNEADSAVLAHRTLCDLGWSDGTADRVASAIEATAGHQATEDVTTAAVLVADLGVLAAQPNDYSAYTHQVRAEYHHLDQQTWNTGRRGVLEQFLDRDRIYDPRLAPDGWEARARANITAELTTLGG